MSLASGKADRIAEYLRLSSEAYALAASCGLDNVKRKHEQAARSWLALAKGADAIPRDLTVGPMRTPER